MPTRKGRGKPATLRDYAKIDFKAWARGPGMRMSELIPAPEVMANHGVTCRMAYAVMLMTANHEGMKRRRRSVRKRNRQRIASRARRLKR